MRKNYTKETGKKGKFTTRSKKSSKDQLKSTTNDPNWYGANESLIRDSASIPWSRPLGAPLNLNSEVFTDSKIKAIPGLCAMQIMPTFGKSVNSDSPINVAATSIYSYIRHANSGHANYDSPDLMLYLMAMSQVYSAIVWLQRTYGIATLYAQKNRYFPDVLIEASRFNVVNLQSNLANFRYRINELINKAASFAVPANMTIFNRHAFLFQNVYSEGSSVKDQMYMYVPAGFYKYTLNADSAGMLEYEGLAYDYTVSQACDYVSDMLRRILYSEDMNIMSGDILKAYGDGGILKLASLPSDYAITPVYDYNVLNQMKNATIVFPQYDLDIVQDETHGFLIANPTARTVENATSAYTGHIDALKLHVYTEERVLTTEVLDPTPNDVIEATRLMVGASNYRTIGNDQRAIDLTFGSEIAVDTYYYTLSQEVATGKTTVLVESVQYSHPIDLGNANNAVLALQDLSNISKFKFHPCHHAFVTQPVEGSVSATKADCGLIFGIDNYTVISNDTLANMHAAALINQFAVPSIAVKR